MTHVQGPVRRGGVSSPITNATKHAEELRSLLKKLLREQKPDPKPTYEPLQAFVRGAMTYDAPDGRADDAGQPSAREQKDAVDGQDPSEQQSPT